MIRGDKKKNIKDIFVYIHIPFCDSKCSYCRFASFPSIQKNKIEKYLDSLCLDIEKYITHPLVPSLILGRGELSSIYFWGWTPSILEWGQINRIIKLLKEKIKFSSEIEITLETTPQKVTEENLIMWKNIWINRVSIWIQTLNEKSLKKIGRLNQNPLSQPFPPREKGVKFISSSFLGWWLNISVDFIIWLPFVKKWEVRKDIEFLLDNYSEIKHVSVYMLEEYIYPKDWKELWIKSEDYLWEYIEIFDFLKSRWFNRYEISNFAKIWYECKHNKAYWDHSKVIWFWLWAHSYVNWFRISNSDNFKDYYEQVENKEKFFIIPPPLGTPFEKGRNQVFEKLTDYDIFLEKVMFQLRTSWIEKKLLKKLDEKNINILIENWYLKLEWGLLKLENKWVLVFDYILKEII